MAVFGAQNKQEEIDTWGVGQGKGLEHRGNREYPSKALPEENQFRKKEKR